MIEGIYPVYKPVGPTSFDVVKQIKRVTGISKVGHGGTLDPLAEGVLVVAVGRTYTKKLTEIIKGKKKYEAEIKLGYVSKTDDAEGPVEKVEVKHIPTRIEVERVLDNFRGEIWQKPPNFSAIKVNGKRAYKLARQGKSIAIKPRKVVVDELTLEKYEWPMIKIVMTTGSGVYVRSLARDVGKELGVGGYITALKRTKVGNYGIEDCVELDWFQRNQ